MKLTPALALLTLATAGSAQTSSTAHHATATTHRSTSTACSSADIPALGAAIPKVAGCPKTLYALKYIDTVIGTGPLAMPMKLYTVNYTGYLTSGTKFDSSVDRKDPIVFPAGFHRVITGWDTGFEGMHVGGKRRLFIPYELAYGDAGKPPTIPAKSMLVFDVELIAQADLPQQPPQQPGRPGGMPGGAQPQQRPATPPAGSAPATNPAAPPPAPGAIPAPAPGTPTTPKPAMDPSKPVTVPPPADPTKPAAVPPSSPSPSSTSAKQ